MRWLKRPPRDERGATIILVAVTMVVVLGFGAIAVDAGAMYAEKSELQNGADAAAIAVAQTCAKSIADLKCVAPSSLSQPLADANAKDGMTKVTSTDVDLAAGKVTVATASRDSAGDHFATAFARIFGINTVDIDAVAVAQWGGIKSAPIPLPMAFSDCEVDVTAANNGIPQFLFLHGATAQKGSTCKSPASGLNVPGGFGWLVPGGGACTLSVTLDSPWVASESGNDPIASCSATMQAYKDQLIAGQKVVVLIPVFDDVTGTGSTAQYHLMAFAAMELIGWDLSGSAAWTYMPPAAQLVKAAALGLPSSRGIAGKFIRFVGLDEKYEYGGPATYGGTTVKLSK